MTYNQYNLIRHKMEEKEKGKKKLFGKLSYVSFIVFQNFKKNLFGVFLHQ